MSPSPSGAEGSVAYQADNSLDPGFVCSPLELPTTTCSGGATSCFESLHISESVKEQTTGADVPAPDLQCHPSPKNGSPTCLGIPEPAQELQHGCKEPTGTSPPRQVAEELTRVGATISSEQPHLSESAKEHTIDEAVPAPDLQYHPTFEDRSPKSPGIAGPTQELQHNREETTATSPRRQTTQEEAIDDADLRFTILHWNVLSDKLTSRYLRVDDWTLDWDYRWPLLRDILRKKNPDLIILVEVTKLMRKRIKKFLASEGYDGKRFNKFGRQQDGTAIFFRTLMFERTGEWKVNQFVGLINGKEKQPQDQLYVAVKLCSNRCNREFVLVATHLKAFSRFESTRVEQVKQILAKLEEYENLPLILAGDFNSTPSELVHQEIRNSFLGLRSVFQTEPKFTNVYYQDSRLGDMCVREQGTVDFIFINSKFEAVSAEITPAENEIGNAGLPNKKHPSDHCALVSEVRFSLR